MDFAESVSSFPSRVLLAPQVMTVESLPMTIAFVHRKEATQLAALLIVAILSMVLQTATPESARNATRAAGCSTIARRPDFRRCRN